ncbi:MAG: GNAT family acetyltransferase [Anaerolineales bacterium]|nr:GNAT family acetyltransferase [Anaerolineales bacterium]MDW8160696.1 GNAT family acetyltransferase [Anaerolineales bacterium]
MESSPDGRNQLKKEVKRDFRVRTFEFPQDYEPVIRLWRIAGGGVHLGPSDTYEEIAKKLQRDPQLFLVAEKEGHVVGAVLGGFDGRRGLVYHLAVHPAERNRGVATALMEELEHRFRKIGCRRVYLLVAPENTTAQQFYERRGWQRMEILTYGKDLE